MSFLPDALTVSNPRLATAPSTPRDGEAYQHSASIAPARGVSDEGAIRSRSHIPGERTMASILLIDDDDALRRTIGRMLTSAGHDVVEAGNGSSVVSLIEVAKPAVVITDVFMPEKNGIDTTKEIRAHSPDMKILAITGGGRAGRFYHLLKDMGVDGVLEKPFTKQALLEAVQQLLR
jgi:CheY-like chemotaxis protein